MGGHHLWFSPLHTRRSHGNDHTDDISADSLVASVSDEISVRQCTKQRSVPGAAGIDAIAKEEPYGKGVCGLQAISTPTESEGA